MEISIQNTLINYQIRITDRNKDISIGCGSLAVVPWEEYYKIRNFGWQYGFWSRAGKGINGKLMVKELMAILDILLKNTPQNQKFRLTVWFQE